MTGKPTTGTLRGTSAADVLIATADGQAVLGLGGDDVLVSLYNHTKLSGGDGNDALTGRATARNGFPEATSRLIGGNGDDAMLASANADGFSHATARTVLNGGDGEDTLTATARANANGGADAINELHGGLGGDSLTAEAEASSISPDSSAVNTIHAGAGDDILVAKSAANGAQGGGVIPRKDKELMAVAVAPRVLCHRPLCLALDRREARGVSRKPKYQSKDT